MSYATIEDADTYFLSRLHTEAWDDLGSSDDAVTTKNKALGHATAIIDRLNLASKPVEVLKQACIEIALSLLDGIDPDLELLNQQETHSSFANIKTTHDRTQLLEHILAGVPSQAAWRMLKPYLVDNRTVTLVRG